MYIIASTKTIQSVLTYITVASKATITRLLPCTTKQGHPRPSDNKHNVSPSDMSDTA